MKEGKSAKPRRRKVTRYVVGLIYRDDALLFLRKKGDPNAPLTLPGVAKKGVGNKRNLNRYFKQEFAVKPRYLSALPEIVIYLEEESYLLRPFVLDATIDAHDAYDIVAVEETDLPSLKLDPSSAAIAKRAFIFAPWYRRQDRTIPLLDRDQEKVYWQQQCLAYFHRRIPSAEREEFDGLVHSASSVRRINEAFAMICNRYGCDPNLYIRYLKYREEKRKAYR